MARKKRGGSRKSLKRPDVYDALRRKGYGKTKAAKISNALAAGTINRKKKRR